MSNMYKEKVELWFDLKKKNHESIFVDERTKLFRNVFFILIIDHSLSAWRYYLQSNRSYQ